MAIGGKDTTFKHGTNGAIAVNTDFTSYIREVNPSFEAEQVDSTTFGDTYRDFEQSFKNATIETTYKHDTTRFGQLAAIYNAGDIVTFEYGPTGIASGNPKITGSMFITKLGAPTKIGELIELAVSWQVSGAVTFSTFA